jgi:hypothetical protein
MVHLAKNITAFLCVLLNMTWGMLSSVGFSQLMVIDLEKNEIVTYMEHKQTIAAGGLYSVGAWKYIFDYV